MGPFQNLVASCVVASMALGSARATAAVTFLGPSPYLSKADSPFPVDGSNPNFYLEDFEPDEPCVPGGSAICGAIPIDIFGIKGFYGGGGIGSSVDGDDGVIDGFGTLGTSASATGHVIIGASLIVKCDFEFDANELGFLPTAVGIVLTNGAGPGSGLGVYDASGDQVSFLTWELELSPHTTSDDRFIGVLNPNGISKIVFSKRIFDSTNPSLPRIDHLQYGLLVPEPTAKQQIIFAIVSVIILSFRFNSQ